MNEDLKKIKDKYGEKMMHLCRMLFPTLLERNGLLINLLESKFHPSKFIYDDIVNNSQEENFKNYIYSLVDIETNEVVTNKSPKELLDEAGYYLIECKTEEDIQTFKRFYAKGEELCTFRGGRLFRCYVFFAIKKNVYEIRREDFIEPRREDEYGTSVLSIQFSKDEVNTLSIKNRYNHTVSNSDSTFSNNLENIISGLTNSFEQTYNLKIQQNDTEELELPGYVMANDGKFYKYNYEINNIYYCPDNIIIDNFNVIRTYETKERYIIIDYFILDLKNKKIELYDKTLNDSFIDGLTSMNNIQITKSKETGNKQINIKVNQENNILIEVDKTNKIVSYNNASITKIKDNFLYTNNSLESINLLNVNEVGDNFLYSNNVLRNLEIFNLNKIGDNFLFKNEILTSINLPSLIQVGSRFLYSNNELRELKLQKLNKVKDSFLFRNELLIKLNTPHLQQVGNSFLLRNNSLLNINLPNLNQVGNNFLFENNSLINIVLPSLNQVGDSFLYNNNTLKRLELLNLSDVGDEFLYRNSALMIIHLPALRQIGDNFLYSCIKKISKQDLRNLNNRRAR